MIEIREGIVVKNGAYRDALLMMYGYLIGAISREMGSDTAIKVSGTLRQDVEKEFKISSSAEGELDYINVIAYVLNYILAGIEYVDKNLEVKIEKETIEIVKNNFGLDISELIIL